jgi:predicted transcriptional regulator
VSDAWGKEMINRRRSEIGILGEILRLAQNGMKKTHIQYKGNLSYVQLQNFLTFAVKKGLLEAESGNPNVMYRTTQKGIELLALIEEFDHMLSE